MVKKLSKLELAQEHAEAAVKKVNEKIDELGLCTNSLYIALNDMQATLDRIRNVPEEEKLKYEKLKAIRISWKQQAENIELEYKKAEMKSAGQGAAGVGAGVAVAALGPTAAMGIATTFGVASTGTAISALSGAAATNAALAWLGGGALAAGGGGMAAGNAFLALAGPVGWAIAGLSIVASGLMLFKTKSDKELLDNIFTLISNRDTKSYELAIVELSERSERVRMEASIISSATRKILTFGTNYEEMTEAQQYSLGAVVNLMEASTALLVNPILGLQPKFTEEDFDNVCDAEDALIRGYYKRQKSMVISLANLLYYIPLDEKETKLLAKSLRHNKKFLESVGMTKKEFDVGDISMVKRALRHRYKLRAY